MYLQGNYICIIDLWIVKNEVYKFQTKIFTDKIIVILKYVSAIPFKINVYT